jgi:hypothetical protein
MTVVVRGFSVMALAPCREVAFEEGDEVFRGEAEGLIEEALHAADFVDGTNNPAGGGPTISRPPPAIA